MAETKRAAHEHTVSETVPQGRALLRLMAVFLLSLMLTVAGCGGGGGGSDDDGDNEPPPSTDVDPPPPTTDPVPPPAGSSTLRVTTYNAGLLPNFVPLADERVIPVAEAVAALDTDVLCLQEVWRPEDVADVTEALGATFPSIFVAPSRQKLAASAPVCAASDLEGVGSCIVNQCVLAGIGILDCLVGSCHDELELLANSNPECAEAITAQVGRPADDIFAIQDILFNDEERAGLFSFEGSPGIILAAKLPLNGIEVLDFFDASTTSRRVAVFATVTKNGVNHRVACTHLQSNLDGLIPYTGQFGNWEGEQRFQASTMINFATRISGNDPQYLAGDFNCSTGNGATGVVGEFPGNCRLFTDAGYEDVAADSLSCTFCSSNTLNQANQSIIESRDVLIDHVFTRNTPYTGIAANRLLTQTVQIQRQQQNLSDHFAVRLDVPVP